jgi:hypothetical protein
MLVYSFIFRGVAFASGAVLVVLVLLLQGIDHCNWTFFFNSSFFKPCASVLSLGHYVVAEAGCNCYSFDINICSLLEKITIVKLQCGLGLASMHKMERCT